MKLKLKIVLLLLLVGMLVVTGCSPATEEPAEEPAEEVEEPDVVSGPTQTMATDEAAMLEGLSADGGWIVIFEDDMSTEEELVLAEGPTNDGEMARKLALYTQDADRNVTARFTLTAPKLTVESVNSRIQGGIFAGDVYVNAEGFRLADAVIEGNLYFASQDLLDAFDASEGEVTGMVGLESDAVASATEIVVFDEDSLVEGMSADGPWIIIFTRDLETEQELVLEGEQKNDDEPARKMALYTQDADRNVLDRFTLTAPSVTVNNENTRIQGGTIAGDVYVNGENFRLVDAVIDGNLYFASQDLLDAFDASEGEVTGEVSVQ